MEWPPLTSAAASSDAGADCPFPPLTSSGNAGALFPQPPSVAPPAPARPSAWGPAPRDKPSSAPTPVLAVAPEPIPSRVPSTCSSSSGIKVAVVDTNAVISGGSALALSADQFVTVPEALAEVRDEVARRRLALLPFTLETVEPAPEFVKKVVKFARETGDLQTLSEVDIKIIALAYMMETYAHGASHLRDCPPPLRVVDVKNFQEVAMPGWGSNVPNLAEWEALDKLSDVGANQESRILPLKDLSNKSINITGSSRADELKNGGESEDPLKDAIVDKKSDSNEINPDEDGENDDGWLPSAGRNSTAYRRYLRRKARHRVVLPSDSDGELCSEVGRDLPLPANVESETCEGQTGLNDDAEHLKEENGKPGTEIWIDERADKDNEIAEGLENLEINSGTEEESCESSHLGDASGEQPWTSWRSSDSSVACITSDYAMQNVILQIGLWLLAPGGMQIRQLHRWILKCHACYSVTQEVGRIFCPKCGNGGTLRKVSVTVGEDGIVMSARRPRTIVRGTKFSLPLPQGGRDAVVKNPILREDQLPQKLLHPKPKKTTKEQDFLCADDPFSLSGTKREPLKPPVRKAMAMFSGRRNPNDNHYTRRKR